VDANRIALAGVREEERVGQRTLLDVLNAEQELLNSEVNLVTDQRNVLVASYTVLSTTEAHYSEVRRKWFDVNITHADGRRERLEPAPAPVK
jgi:outer membrane protein